MRFGARLFSSFHLLFYLWNFLLVSVIRECEAGYKTVCYYESWAIYRRTDSRLGADFTISQPPCTHLIYAFAVIKNGELTAFDPTVDLDGDGQYGGYNKFNQITKRARPVITLLAVGGWNAGSKEFSDVAASEETRQIFAEQTVTYLRRYGFQGLDVDWEYPADREGSRPEDKENFSQLLQALRAAFDAEEKQPGRSRLLLTVALSPHPDKLDKSYDMASVGEFVDFVNIMTYDYARAGWSVEIKPHNPLWRRPEDTEWQSQLNAEWAVQKMIKEGVPSEKLILGIPTYGVTYKIPMDSVPKIHGSHQGAGDAGPITKEKGYLAFHEICRRLKLEKGWTCLMDQAGTPICYRKSELVSFENPKSARNKAMFIMKYKMGGAMIWSLATDDFNGFCYGKKFAITQTVRDTFDASTKMMGREDTEQGSALETVPEYCVKDPKANAPDCVKVFCPEIKRYFMPYEYACVNVLGKCSYPKIQVCDTPRLSSSYIKVKFSLYTPYSSKPANLSCASGITPATEVTSMSDKCRKRFWTCESNQLGGYNINDYICPLKSDFDPAAKVCKIPDTVDSDDDPCPETVAPALPATVAPVRFTLPYAIPTKPRMTTISYRPQLLGYDIPIKTQEALEKAVDDAFDDPRTYPLEAEDRSSFSQPQIPNDVQASQTDTQIISPSQFFNDFPQTRSNAASIPSPDKQPPPGETEAAPTQPTTDAPPSNPEPPAERPPPPPQSPPPAEAQRAPPSFMNSKPSFRKKPIPVAPFPSPLSYPVRPPLRKTLESQAPPRRVAPPLKPRQQIQENYPPPQLPERPPRPNSDTDTRDDAMEMPHAEALQRVPNWAATETGNMEDRRQEIPASEDRPARRPQQRWDGGRRAEKPRKGLKCSPIGARVPNPKQPCSGSFLLCITNYKIIELSCARGQVYDGTLNYCIPAAAAALSCRAR
ncbi:hypothetical protein RvY_06543 [Ramazzottius varieornatus]|uniref:GH18 domain-containing protein n=1 Tax=Ramazzottius varieornatus TaxID=947166 RepID=A0A1D1V7M7_RAMVA|nr:hypothetical protein RvY_06543 [Ramazzottius varieornatus]